MNLFRQKKASVPITAIIMIAGIVSIIILSGVMLNVLTREEPETPITRNIDFENLIKNGKYIEAVISTIGLEELDSAEAAVIVDKALRSFAAQTAQSPGEFHKSIELLKSAIVFSAAVNPVNDLSALMEAVELSEKEYRQKRFTEYLETLGDTLLKTDGDRSLTNFVMRASYEFGDQFIFYSGTLNVIRETVDKLSDQAFMLIYPELFSALDMMNQISLQGLTFEESEIDGVFIELVYEANERYYSLFEETLLGIVQEKRNTLETIMSTATILESKEAELILLNSEIEAVYAESQSAGFYSLAFQTAIEELKEEIVRAYEAVVLRRNALYNRGAVDIIDQAYTGRKNYKESAQKLKSLDKSRFTQEVSTYYMTVLSKIVQDLKDKDLKEFMEIFTGE